MALWKNGTRLTECQHQNFKFLSHPDSSGKTCPPEQVRKKIHIFMQGAVYCWCNVKKGDEFAFRDLFGDDNADWNGTPLQRIYNYYLDKYTKENRDSPEGTASKQAAADAGKMLSEVLIDDKRDFAESENYHDQTQHYTWQK